MKLWIYVLAPKIAPNAMELYLFLLARNSHVF